MSSRPRLAMTFTSDMEAREIGEIAALTERHGLDELWVFEDCFSWGAMPLVSAALAATERLRVGIALAPVPLRSIALLAMEVATLERMHPGRVLPGIGTGVVPWMEQVGEGVPSPMGRLRESADALRALLAGEEVTTEGQYVRLREVRLQSPPSTTLPIYIGAGGPKMLALAGAHGDGTLLGTGLTEEQVADKVSRTVAAAHAAGKTAHDVVLLHLVATGADASGRLAAGLARWGTPRVEAGGAGSAAEVAAGVARLAAFGVSSVSFMATPDVTDHREFIRFLGEDVAPLLR